MLVGNNRKQIKTAKDMLRSSALKAISSFVQEAVIFPDLEIRYGKKGDDDMRYGEAQGCFVCKCKKSAGVRRPIGLGFQYLSTR